MNTLFSMNRRPLKAYLLKESLERLWFHRYEGAMLRYLQSWMHQLRWQRQPFEKLAESRITWMECVAPVPYLSIGEWVRVRGGALDGMIGRVITFR
jgi:hypothetical protein